MVYIVVSFAIFLFTLFAQIFLYRFLQKKGIVTFRMFLLFILGFFLDVLLMMALSACFSDCRFTLVCYPLPWSGILVYTACSLTWLIASVSPLLGDESPSSKIIAEIFEKGPRTKKQLVDACSDTVVTKRLADMEAFGWIKKNGVRYLVLPKGLRLVVIILWYRKLLRMELTG